MLILDNEPSSVILRQTNWFQTEKKIMTKSILFCTFAISVPHHPDKKCNFTWLLDVHTQ